MKISFDQAASFYDRTRTDPAWVMDAMADAFIRAAHATRRSRILEVGVGTGRIAMPLVERGLNLVGVDLSVPMMRELKKKILGKDSHVTLAQTDAEALPFPGETFDAVYAVHVYHLILNWRDALVEARRVLKPGGIFFLSYHYRDRNSPHRKIRQKLNELARERGFETTRPGAKDHEFRAELEKWNGHVETIEVARWTYPSIPAEILDEVEARIYSDTWLLPAAVQAEIMPGVRQWARGEFGDLSRKVETDGEFNWLVVRKT
jgi:ubiquinone/menaquinone biosynthesis C-methylase UbiE